MVINMPPIRLPRSDSPRNLQSFGDLATSTVLLSDHSKLESVSKALHETAKFCPQ